MAFWRRRAQSNMNASILEALDESGMGDGVVQTLTPLEAEYQLFCQLTAMATREETKHELAKKMFALMPLFKQMDDIDRWQALGAGGSGLPSITAVNDLLEEYAGCDCEDLKGTVFDMPDVRMWCPNCKGLSCRVCQANAPVRIYDNTKTDRQCIVNAELLTNYLRLVDELIGRLQKCQTKKGAKELKLPMCPADIAYVATGNLKMAKAAVSTALNRLALINFCYRRMCQAIGIPADDEKPQQIHMLAKRRYMLLYPTVEESSIHNWLESHLETVKKAIYSYHG